MRNLTVGRGLLWLVAALLALTAINAVLYLVFVAPRTAAPVDFDKTYPEGSCVVFSGDDDAAKELGPGDCAGSHTHVVIARVGPDASCPPGTDERMELPGDRYAGWCLRRATSPSP